MPKVTVTNVDHDPRQVGPDAGMRGLWTTSGLRHLRPGETAELEMSDAEIESSKRSGWFHFGEDAPATPAFVGKTMAQRRAEGIGR